MNQNISTWLKSNAPIPKYPKENTTNIKGKPYVVKFFSFSKFPSLCVGLSSMKLLILTPFTIRIFYSELRPREKYPFLLGNIMLAAKAKINEVEIFLDEGSYKRKSGESSEETFFKMMLLVFSL